MYLGFIMKLLSNVELFQISGCGTFRVNGRTVYVDTTGIPGNCVTQIERMTRDMFAHANGNPSASSLFTRMGSHVDALMNSGCDDYLATYSARLNNARVV